MHGLAALAVVVPLALTAKRARGAVALAALAKAASGTATAFELSQGIRGGLRGGLGSG